MMEILQYDFMRNALAAALLASAACGIIGPLVVVRRITFISGAIAHAAFGGIGLGYYLGINPLAAVLPFSVLSALGMGVVSRKARIPEDTSIGMFWAAGMAAGILFIGATPGYASDLFSYLFGNILVVPSFDLTLMAAMDAVIIFACMLFYRQFTAVCFDEEYAEASGLRAGLFYYLMLCLVALTVVVLIRVVGIILLIALLTIPAASARLLKCRSLRMMMVVSTCFSMLFTAGGLWLSFALDLASGATIILFSAAGFLAVYAMKRLSRRPG